MSKSGTHKKKESGLHWQASYPVHIGCYKAQCSPSLLVAWNASPTELLNAFLQPSTPALQVQMWTKLLKWLSSTNNSYNPTCPAWPFCPFGPEAAAVPEWARPSCMEALLIIMMFPSGCLLLLQGTFCWESKPAKEFGTVSLMAAGRRWQLIIWP